MDFIEGFPELPSLGGFQSRQLKSILVLQMADGL